MHLNVEYSNGNGRPRGKDPDYDSEYVYALRIGDKRKIKMCLDKNTYRTECEVETEIERSARKRGRQLRWYECPYCGWYHITHQPARTPLKAA